MSKGSKVLHSIHKTDGVGLFEDVYGSVQTVTIDDGETYTATIDAEILAASVKTLNATAVSVIAAPGAGKYIVVNWCEALLVHNGVDYDAAGAGEDLVLKYTDASGAAITDAIDHSGFGDASADSKRFTRGSSDFAPVTNAAIVAHLLVGEWWGAAGDGDLELRINYTIHSAA
jgi:hypothetical protein